MGVDEEEPLFVFTLRLKHEDETEGLHSFVCDTNRDVFDLERCEWYRRGVAVNGGVLLFRGRDHK